MAQPGLLTRQAASLFSRNTIRPGPSACRRTLFGGPSTPLTLHATRTLPYKTSELYKIISDITEYPHFIPYCSNAKVVAWTSRDSITNTKWPAAATMNIGYGGFSAEFLSKVYCIPDTIVEAISGDARTSIPAPNLAHYEGLDSNMIRTQNELFTSLKTRWTLKGYDYKPADQHPEVKSGETHPAEISVEKAGSGSGEIQSEPRTDVSLVIEVNWKNPIYAAASQTLAPSVAGKIVEAFEKRAKEVLSKQHS